MMAMRVAQKLITSASTGRGMMTNLSHRFITTTAAKPMSIAQHITITTSGSISVPALDPVSSGVDLSLDQLRTSIAGADYLRLLAKDNPYLDVVHYTHKNVFYNTSTIDYYSEAVSCGIMENGLIPGDIALSFLPPHLIETMMLHFTCSKSGLILYNIDPDIAIEDPFKAKEILKAALTISKANIFFSFEAANDVNYIRLVESVIPELRYFDFSSGMPFITPRFPHLRFCIHTGFDQNQKWGWLPLHHMIVPSENLATHIDLKLIHHQTPLAGQFEYDANGLPTGLGQTLTNAEVFEKKHWPTYCKILERQFHVVEEIGVIF